MNLIQSEVVTLYHWLDLSTFNDLITISQMTPGPIAINSSTFVGIKVAGIPGAFIATLGCILPSCIIVTGLSYLYLRYKKGQTLEILMSYLRPIIIIMILLSGLSILNNYLFMNGIISPDTIRYHGILLCLCAMILIRKTNINPILVMVLTGCLELLFI